MSSCHADISVWPRVRTSTHLSTFHLDGRGRTDGRTERRGNIPARANWDLCIWEGSWGGGRKEGRSLSERASNVISDNNNKASSAQLSSDREGMRRRIYYTYKGWIYIAGRTWMPLWDRIKQAPNEGKPRLRLYVCGKRASDELDRLLDWFIPRVRIHVHVYAYERAIRIFSYPYYTVCCCTGIWVLQVQILVLLCANRNLCIFSYVYLLF